MVWQLMDIGILLCKILAFHIYYSIKYWISLFDNWYADGALGPNSGVIPLSFKLYLYISMLRIHSYVLGSSGNLAINHTYIILFLYPFLYNIGISYLSFYKILAFHGITTGEYWNIILQNIGISWFDNW
jgi:hypothetical protein